MNWFDFQIIALGSFRNSQIGNILANAFEVLSSQTPKPVDRSQTEILNQRFSDCL